MLPLKIARALAIILAIITLPYLLFAVPISVLFALSADAFGKHINPAGRKTNPSVGIILVVISAISTIWFGFTSWEGLGSYTTGDPIPALMKTALAGTLVLALITIYAYLKPTGR